MKRRYKVLIIVFIFLVGVGIAFKLIIDSMEKNLEELMAIQIEDIDLSNVSDGTYEGAYKATPIEVNVSVTVVNHIITDIDITKHVTGQGESAEVIIEDVILEQSLEVDLVSGATYSSKVILLAIFDALDQ